MELRPHQIAAIAAFDARTTNHSLFDMVCGSGKSLVMHKICKKFNKVLCVFPTIDLLHYYYKNYERENPNVLIVCSQDVSYGNMESDEDVAHIDEIALLSETRAQVTTDTANIEAFIARENFTVLVTYASYGKFLGIKTRFDCVAFDEAHHVNQMHLDTLFADQWVFMSATPTAFLLDECNVVFKYTINQAIADKVTCDYDLHIVQYEHDETSGDLDTHRSTLVESCLRVMKLLDVRKGLSFHRYAKSSKTGFNCSSANEFISMRELFVNNSYIPYVVDGSMHSRVREEILGRFESHDRSIIHNCNLFGEGINSVDLDCVIYIDSKQSSRTIIQALGRALRYKDGKKAVILIPVNMYGCVDIEDAINRGKWKAVVDILKGLRHTDERVMNLLMGRRENSKKLYLHTAVADIEFNDNETSGGYVRLLKDINRGNWNVKYEQLQEYVNKNGKYPNKRSDDEIEKTLGAWVARQRKIYNGTSYGRDLSDNQIAKLESLTNFAWHVDLDLKWENSFEQLREYVDKNKKYPRISGSNDPIEKTLGKWLSTQRSIYNGKSPNGTLSNDQIAKLESLINFTWPVTLDLKWENSFEQLRDYASKHGKYPSHHSKDPTERTLGKWIARQRLIYSGTSKNGTLTDDQLDKLNSLPLDWHPNRNKANLKLINSLDTSVLQSQPLILPTANPSTKSKSYMRASRPNQAMLRKFGLQKFKKCVLSHTTIPKLLDTMHIVPHAYLKKHNAPDEFIDHEDNIIIMCKDLHVLFDAYDFTFTDKGLIHYDKTNVELSDYLKKRCVDLTAPIENFTENWYFYRHRAFYCQIHGAIPATDLHEIEVEASDE